MKLVSIYGTPLDGAAILYALLMERDPSVNISHRKMPSFSEHCAFIQSRPYAAWYLIAVDDEYVGAIYLTKTDEIGISIFAASQGYGHGENAVRLLIKTHPSDRFLANINPDNNRSLRFFEKLGFRHLQNTYELRS